MERNKLPQEREPLRMSIFERKVREKFDNIVEIIATDSAVPVYSLALWERGPLLAVALNHPEKRPKG